MKKKSLYTIAALLIGLPAIFYALIYTPAPKQANPSQLVTLSELSKHTGINGNDCWVAVDGTVYSISGFSQWEMGKHTPSNGKATCGRDLSGVIGESPHGKSVLQLLRVVGTLE
jgi:predicted heme/steroid binding protein